MDENHQVLAERLKALSERLSEIETVRLRELHNALTATDRTREEMERRLGEMNMMRSQINEERGRYLSREAFDEFVRGWSIWRDSVNDQLSRNSGKGAAYTAVVAIGISLAGLLLAFLRHP